MTGRQRIEAALRREKPDAVPIFLRDLTLGLDLCDYSTPEVCAGGPGGYDSEKSARAVIETQRALGHDCVVGAIHDLGLDIDALGGGVEFPERGIPYVGRPPFSSPEEVAAAPRPAEVLRRGRLPGLLHSYRLVAEAVGDHVSIAANVEGPVTKAGLLRGLDSLMLDMVRNPDAARLAVDYAVALACEHVTALLDAGAHFIFIAAASDGPAAIRPKDYLQYTLPGLARIVAAAHSRGADVVFHPHGPFTQDRFHHLVDAAIETGITGFQFGEDNDLAVAKARWGDRVCLLGGVDIPHALLPGPLDLIRDETRACLQAAGPDGYILMPSCSLHRGFPLDHLRTMIDTARAVTQAESRP